MLESIQPYSSGVLALGCYGALYIAQLLVADAVGIVRRHTPGTPIGGDHSDLLFRAARTHANTTEIVGAVILVAGFALLSGADPVWLNPTLWVLLGFRALHTFAYYANLRVMRSVAFGLGVATLLVVFALGLRAF